VEEKYPENSQKKGEGERQQYGIYKLLKSKNHGKEGTSIKG